MFFVLLVSLPIHSLPLPTTLFLFFLFDLSFFSFEGDFIHSSFFQYLHQSTNTSTTTKHDNTSAHHIHIFHKKKKKNKGCENSPHNPILPTSVEFYPMVPNLKSQKVRPLTTNHHHHHQSPPTIITTTTITITTTSTTHQDKYTDQSHTSPF